MMGKGCEGFCYLSKILDETVVVANKTKECSNLFSIFGGCIILIAAVFEGSGFIPVVLRTWPIY